jgi:hypothetical protein
VTVAAAVAVATAAAADIEKNGSSDISSNCHCCLVEDASKPQQRKIKRRLAALLIQNEVGRFHV